MVATVTAKPQLQLQLQLLDRIESPYKNFTKLPLFSTFSDFLVKTEKFPPIPPLRRICRDRPRMSRSQSSRSLQFLLFPYSLSLISVSVLGDEHSRAKDSDNTKNDDARRGPSLGIKIIIICLGVVAVIAFSVILFKLWQKKKREEQHARLLKLFEDDDELEVELGLRD